MGLERCPVCNGKRTIPIGEARRKWKLLGVPEHEPRVRCAPCEGTGWVGGRAAELAFIEWTVQREKAEVTEFARLRAAGDALAAACREAERLFSLGMLAGIWASTPDHPTVIEGDAIRARMVTALATWETATGPGEDRP